MPRSEISLTASSRVIRLERKRVLSWLCIMHNESLLSSCKPDVESTSISERKYIVQALHNDFIRNEGVSHSCLQHMHSLWHLSGQAHWVPIIPASLLGLHHKGEMINSSYADIVFRFSQDAFLEKHGVKLGFMSAFVKASTEALQDIPAVNGVIDGTDIIYRDYYDISIAVATPKGLVVPVLRNADRLDFAGVERVRLSTGALTF